LINVAVTNLVESAGDQKQSSGRDIGKMFRQQETVLRDWTVGLVDAGSCAPVPHPEIPDQTDNGVNDQPEWGDEDDEEESLFSVQCEICSAAIPHFAQLAHRLYHESMD
jgi:DNA polymerase iota